MPVHLFGCASFLAFCYFFIAGLITQVLWNVILVKIVPTLSQIGIVEGMVFALVIAGIYCFFDRRQLVYMKPISSDSFTLEMLKRKRDIESNTSFIQVDGKTVVKNDANVNTESGPESGSESESDADTNNKNEDSLS